MGMKVISIAGKALKADTDGDFIVSRKQLRVHDLRALPPDTVIVVSDFRTHRNDPVRIHRIEGPMAVGFEAIFDYYRCPHCWTSAFSYSKFMDAAKELLIGASNTALTYDDTVLEDDGIHHFFHTTRSEFKIDDMEVALENEVNATLAQLRQFMDELNQQVKQQFNV